MNKLAEFFQEDNGRFSSTRLAFLVWVFAVLIGWGVASARLNKLQEIPESVQVLIGVLMTGKVTQKFAEDKPSKQPSASSTVSSPTSSQVPTLTSSAPDQASSAVPDSSVVSSQHFLLKS